MMLVTITPEQIKPNVKSAVKRPEFVDIIVRFYEWHFFYNNLTILKLFVIKHVLSTNISEVI